MKDSKIKFYVERSSFWAQSAVTFMILAIVFRVVGCWGMWSDSYFLMTQILLPILSGLLFIVLLALLGKAALWTTFIPVLGGVAFFVLKAFSFENTVQMLIYLLIYAVVAIVYCGTVFTLIRTKWVLVPLFLLPLCYHIGYLDIAALRDTANPVTFTAGMQEISVLCIMLSMLFTSIGMKKLVKEPKGRAQKDKDEKDVAPAPAPAPAPVKEPEKEPIYVAPPEVDVPTDQDQN